MEKRRKPDFIGLGAMKAGTSWIYACLREHPNTWMRTKEAQFFTRRWDWGLNWYEGLFGEAPEEKLTGEFSTTYLTDMVAPRRIQTYYPGARLIACLRDPMERAFSHFLHHRRMGRVAPCTSFMQAVNDHPTYISFGRYGSAVSRLRRYFSRHQIGLCIYEDSLVDPQVFINGIYSFLGLPPFTPTCLHKRINVRRVPWSLRMERLIEWGGHAMKGYTPYIYWLLKLLGVGSRLKGLNTKNVAPEGMELAPSDKVWLYEAFFADDIDDLEGLTGMDLRRWKL